MAFWIQKSVGGRTSTENRVPFGVRFFSYLKCIGRRHLPQCALKFACLFEQLSVRRPTNGPKLLDRLQCCDPRQLAQTVQIAYSDSSACSSRFSK
jgi:hypothetical protein